MKLVCLVYHNTPTPNYSVQSVQLYSIILNRLGLLKKDSTNTVFVSLSETSLGPSVRRNERGKYQVLPPSPHEKPCLKDFTHNIDLSLLKMKPKADIRVES